MEFLVSRVHGRSTTMYLQGFDVIWGPVWAMSRDHAARFVGADKAETAMDDAVACMRPAAWRVPDFGGWGTLHLVPVPVRGEATTGM